jgi:lipoic acid synthetase
VKPLKGDGLAEAVGIGRGPGAFRHRRLPPHCVVPPRREPEIARLEGLLRSLGLHSVCEEARCPNRPECWSKRHVTFMLLGDTCTRACRFCAVATGRPKPPDAAEPGRVARAAAQLGLSHVVLTSVNRDDLPDGGAAHFAACLAALRDACPGATLEVLTPDFRGDLAAVATVCAAAPDVYNHNVETVPRLYRRVRPGALFERSLAVLGEARRRRPGAVVKSGLMVGLGEQQGEVLEALARLRGAGVDALTIGQYLRPTRHHLEVERYWEPAEFDELGEAARALGFQHVASGPLIRSSFNADTTLAEMRAARGAPASA